MSTVRDFRTTLQATLTQAYGFPFVGGPVDRSQKSKDLGCVWLEGKRPMAADGNMEEVIYGVRVIRVWRQGQGDNVTSRNVAALEDDVELLQETLRAVLTSQGHDFFNVAAVTADYEKRYVEATLVAFQRNLGARGG